MMSFLVKNYWADLKIIWHKYSFGNPLPILIHCRESRIDQDIMIELMMHLMPMLILLKFSFNIVKLDIYRIISLNLTGFN